MSLTALTAKPSLKVPRNDPRGVLAMSINATPRNVKYLKKFRCVWCVRMFPNFAKLVSHEPLCDCRHTKQREWGMRIERAKRRFEKTGEL